MNQLIKERTKMKKLTVLLLVAALLCTLLASCGVSSNDANTNQQGSQNGSQGSPAVDTANLTVAGKSISDFTIIYARSEYYAQGPKTFTTEWDFYKLTAMEIRRQIYQYTGVTLDVKKDKDTAPLENEILVGPTDRDESSFYDSLDVYSYENKVLGGKLVVGGGYNASYLTGDLKKSYSWAATYHAFDYISEYIASKMQEGIADIDLQEGFSQKGKCDFTTFACIGDSITEGHASTDWNYCSYPAVMQRVLWQDCIVINYGKSAKTMRNDLTEKKYKETAQYNAVLKYQQLFDGVLIMLGTNDGGVDTVFSAQDDKLYNESAYELVQKLTNNNEKLEIAILNCTAYYGTNFGARQHVRGLQKKLVTSLKNDGYSAHFVDMQKFTESELGKSHFPDGIHPDNAGYAMMGEYLAKVGSAIIEGSWDSDKQTVTVTENTEAALSEDKRYII